LAGKTGIGVALESEDLRGGEQLKTFCKRCGRFGEPFIGEAAYRN